MDKNIIFDSTVSTIKKRTWKSLRDHYWHDFALALFENDSEMSAKGVQVERGQSEQEILTEQSAKGIEIMSMLHELELENDSDMSVAIFVSTVNFYAMMMDYLPWYDKINLTFQDELKAIDVAFRYLEERNNKIYRNLFLDTAIEMLPLFEKRLGIEIYPHLSYEQRRRQIQARRIAAFEQTTVDTIKKVCSAFSNNNAGVEVNLTDVEGIYDIKFTSNGLPNNMPELDKTLDIMFPAHLSWKYSYTQNTWGNGTSGGKIRWKDLEPYSWATFNEYREGGIRV